MGLFDERKKRKELGKAPAAYRAFNSQRISTLHTMIPGYPDTWDMLREFQEPLLDAMAEATTTAELTKLVAPCIRVEHDPRLPKGGYMLWRCKWTERYDMALSSIAAQDLGLPKSELLFTVAHQRQMQRMLTAPKWKDLVAYPLNKNPWYVFVRVDAVDALGICAMVNQEYLDLVADRAAWPDPLGVPVIDWDPPLAE